MSQIKAVSSSASVSFNVSQGKEKHKSKLYKLEQEAQEKKLKEISGDVSDNSFGSQIRSYVFHPYSMIKDHRTNFEVFNTTAVMDGEIGGFINAYLKSPFNK